jgi:beta-glucosidase/6-phospho-beta-glucosidase/beta-galactosidase
LTRIFKSFLQAGFECSTHKLENGRRLDLVSSTRHDIFVERDFARLRELGIRTVREGIRWTVIERRPGVMDFSSVMPFLKAAREQKIEIVWDLLHFGWPDHLDIFEASWIDAFTSLSEEFACLLKRESDAPWFVAPVNEISFMAWAGGEAAFLNPFRHNCGAEIKAQLVSAFLGAAQALRSKLPGVKIVSPEPVIHIVGRPEVDGDDIAAERYRTSMFQSWDMLTGRLHPELGGGEKTLDVIGVNYYNNNQWVNFGRTIWLGDSQYRPFREILAEVWNRYHLPLFVAETGTENEGRPDWFRYIAGEVHAAIDNGIPVEGLCLYPILNHPGWADDRHCFNGLWDYASDSGDREIYEPLAAEIRRQRDIFERQLRNR